MSNFRIKKGYNVPIKGKAEAIVKDGPSPSFVGVMPASFRGVKPKLAVAVDDQVKVGSKLFFDKGNPDLVFVSPAAGKVSAINYGARRSIQEIVIAVDPKQESESHKAWNEKEFTSENRGEIIGQLLAGGVWPFLIQRPFGKIANPEASPKSIFVNCMDSAPLANDPEFSLKEKIDSLDYGIAALACLTEGSVHVCMGANSAFAGLKNGTKHTFSGKHPAGLVGTHIAKIDPINRGEVVWTIHARDLVLLADFLKTGVYQTERLVAIAGTAAEKRTYVKTQIGVRLSDLVGEVDSEKKRVIQGNVLTGTTSNKDEFLGLYCDLLTVIPEGHKRHFIGWMLPGFNKPSYSRALLSSFIPGKTFEMDTNYNGGHRAIVQSGLYENVVAIDVPPEFLIKAAITENIEEMEAMGILEVAPEDFALCSYICPSKTEVTKIIQDGLDLMEREG